MISICDSGWLYKKLNFQKKISKQWTLYGDKHSWLRK